MLSRSVILGAVLAWCGSFVAVWGTIAQRQGRGGGFAALGLTAGLLLMGIGLLKIANGFSIRNAGGTFLRLDHFLPLLRKRKRKAAPRPESAVLRIVRQILPEWLFSNWETGKPGTIRRLLARLGPTVVSAPVRRASQAFCLLLFLWLFFYVCWPYSAQPTPPGEVSPGWRLDRLLPETGDVHFAGDVVPTWLSPSQTTVYLVAGDAPEPVRGEFGEFYVVATERRAVTLRTSEPWDDDRLEQLLTHSGTWALHERSPWPSHYADDLRRKELLPAEIFLAIDPLVSLSTAIASRSWVWSLVSAGIILLVCVLIPRGFCGYLCPLGTLIDLFDWCVSRRWSRLQVSNDGWWVHIKYYLLLGTMLCAVAGVLVSGYVAAIPVITRGMLFLGEPLQSGILRGSSQLPPPHVGHWISLALFFAVLGLGLLKPRFWCKYVCPSGAVFSLGNLFRLTERKVESSCIHCNKCVEICPFDAIKADFTTRTTDCTLCQTCAGVCPTEAIKFVERWNLVELKLANDPPTGETALGRRGFLSLTAGATAAALGSLALTVATRTLGARLEHPDAFLPVRPPGSVPEREFLQMCIRCGECFKACPYNVLQPMGLEQGLEGLWTPQVVADHAGCASSCNACGQVCPTGAIRAIPLDEKRFARMGLAIVNPETCLPWAGRDACQLCVDECTAAGYNAIEFQRVHTLADENGNPVEGSGFLAPIVVPQQCVGCGLCQMACHRVNVRQQDVLAQSAIIIEAGPGKEDRLMDGSYRALRRDEAQARRERERSQSGGSYFLPPDQPPPRTSNEADPFGLE